MRVPLDWLREYCDPALDAKGIEERLTMTGTKVEAIHHHGVGAVEKFVVGRVLEVEQHPDADRLKVCKVDLGEVLTRGCRGRLVPAGDDRVRGAECCRWTDGRGCDAGCGDARWNEDQAGEAQGRGLRRDDLRRDRAGFEPPGLTQRGDPRAGRSHARRGVCPGNPARGRAADRRRGAGAGDHAEPARLSRGLRGRARAARGHRSAAHRRALERGPGFGRSRGRRRGGRRVPRSVLALHRARVRGRRGRPLAALVEGAADGGRAETDQQRRRHHQLRDAADRPAAARVRPRPRRAARV